MVFSASLAKNWGVLRAGRVAQYSGLYTSSSKPRAKGGSIGILPIEVLGTEESSFCSFFCSESSMSVTTTKLFCYEVQKSSFILIELVFLQISLLVLVSWYAASHLSLIQARQPVPEKGRRAFPNAASRFLLSIRPFIHISTHTPSVEPAERDSPCKF